MRLVITLSGSKYVGMCAPEDPEDNLRLGYRDDLPVDGYFVPTDDETNDYYPIKVIPVSKKHAVVIERKYGDSSKILLYKANLNGGIYDPGVEECEYTTEPHNVWENQVKVDAGFEAIVDGFSFENNDLVVLLRSVQPIVKVVSKEEHNLDYPGSSWSFPSWAYPYDVTHATRYTLYYSVLRIHAPLKSDIDVVWVKNITDHILVPQAAKAVEATEEYWWRVIDRENADFLNHQSIWPHYVNLNDKLYVYGGYPFRWSTPFADDSTEYSAKGSDFSSFTGKIDYASYYNSIVSVAKRLGLWWEQYPHYYYLPFSGWPWQIVVPDDVLNYVTALENFALYKALWFHQEPSAAGTEYLVETDENLYYTDAVTATYQKFNDSFLINRQHAVEYTITGVVEDGGVITR